MPKKIISKKKKKKTIKPKIQKVVKQLSNSVTKLLDTAKVKYKTIEHKVVFTAHDVSATTKKKLSEIAKVVLVKVEGTIPSAAEGSLKKPNKGFLTQMHSFGMAKNKTSFVLIVLPAGKYVDFKGIKKALKAKKVSMANEKDITKYLKTKVGLLHPFGSAYDIQTLLDKGIYKSKKMIASAGTYTHSVELAVKDFEKVVSPIKGLFSKAKK